ncbi:MAG: RNA polymerase sigma factor WhiG [Limnochordaceae bacterium]|nr:RNA polymerase sigma factor WhiG [Limnochordaceae bacterium]
MAIQRSELAPEGATSGQAEQLWRQYKKTGDPRTRERLVLAATPLVKYCAGRIAIGLPPNVEMDDLISYGIFGLLDAVEKFDPKKGVKFETYAIARIRGAILDGLRAADWVPRSVRQKAREVERVVARLESRLGRPAADEEVARELGVDVQRYHQILQDVQGAALLSLEEGWVDESGELEYSLAQLVVDPSNQDPGQALEFEEGRRRLAEAIERLPERERLVITLYYYEGLTLKEIGAVLGVSESRVSQMHTKAILRLRGYLTAPD